MDNNVIQHLGRGHHQAPVKGKGPAAGTAAPAGVLPAYGDAAVGTACKLMIVRHSHGKIGCRRLAVSFFKGLFLGNGHVSRKSKHNNLVFCLRAGNIGRAEP